MATTQLESFVLLVFLSLSYSAALSCIERLRLAVSSGTVPNIMNAWVLAGAALLPKPMVALLVVLLCAGEWPARAVAARKRPFHYIYSSLALAVCAVAASAVLPTGPALAGAVLAIATFTGLNITLILIAMAVAGDFRHVRQFLSLDGHVSELVTAATGLVLAAGMAGWTPLVAFAVLPVLGLLHRHSLQRVIRDHRAFDSQTLLWSEQTWRNQAAHLLLKSVAYTGLILIDPELPHMDAMIVEHLGGAVRPGVTDLIGRFGTRQIAVMMPVGPASGGRWLANDIRTQLRNAGIAVSVGYAVGGAKCDLGDMCIGAMACLMADRSRAGVTSRW